MNQQRLQLIHIGQVVPCPSCIPTVTSTILSRGIRLSCPHQGTGVILNTANTSALRQDCIGNHLSNKELLERIYHDRDLPLEPSSVNI